jgi:hypothetical protein
MDRRLALFVAAAGACLAAALLWWSAPDVEPDGVDAARAAPPAAAARQDRGGPKPQTEAEEPDAAAPDMAGRGAPAAVREASPGVPFASTEAEGRARFLEERVREFVTTIEGEAADLDVTCEQTGARCTFEGPVPDGFVKRWVQALAHGELEHDAVLRGITFADVQFEEIDGVKHIALTAVHPER